MGDPSRSLFTASALACLALAAQGPTHRADADGWPYYGHDAGGMRYSPLTQITRANVSRLKVAWVFHTGDLSEGLNGDRRSGFETTPLVVDGTLYLTTPFNRVIALDPETGAKRWAFDPIVELKGDYGDGLINRGLATWIDGSRRTAEPCRRRLFEATLDARLIALDAATGSPCTDFGEKGQISLRNVPVYEAGWYHMTSPPAVIDDMVIDPYLRAFDVETGRELWKGELPASGHATPVTYQLRSAGKQYVVIAAGGHAKVTEERVDDALVAFALDR